MLHRSIQTVKFLLKSVNLCKFTAWYPDVLADKPHPRNTTKILSKKMRLIRRCIRYFDFLKCYTLYLKNLFFPMLVVFLIEYMCSVVTVPE